MSSDCRNAQSGSHKDVTHTHPNPRDASLRTEHCIKHCVWGAWRHSAEYQAHRKTHRPRQIVADHGRPRPAPNHPTTQPPNHQECLFHWPCKMLASAQHQLIRLTEWGGAEEFYLSGLPAASKEMPNKKFEFEFESSYCLVLQDLYSLSLWTYCFSACLFKVPPPKSLIGQLLQVWAGLTHCFSTSISTCGHGHSGCSDGSFKVSFGIQAVCIFCRLSILIFS